MRIAVIGLAVVAGLACRDKQPARRDEPASAPRPTTPRAPEAPRLETPTVTGPGLVPARELGPKLTVGRTAIELDGQAVVAIGPDGLIDPARVQVLVRQLEKKATTDAPIAIAFDAALPYRRVGQLLDALRQAGLRNLALLTGTGAEMIPIELPDSAEFNAAGLRPVVTLERTRLALWSASGQEGTKRQPKLVLSAGDDPSFARVTRALAEIVERRWPDGKRAPDDRTIIVQLDGDQPAQVLLQLLAAVRADGSRELFPNIFLAGGR